MIPTIRKRRGIPLTTVALYIRRLNHRVNERKYHNSEKAKQTRQAYANSEKGIAARRRYDQSEVRKQAVTTRNATSDHKESQKLWWKSKAGAKTTKRVALEHKRQNNMSRKHAVNFRQIWTIRDYEKILAMREQGHTLKDISVSVGRTISAVSVKLVQLHKVKNNG